MGHDIMSELRVRESGDFGRYDVQSETDPEMFYVVQPFQLGERCSCDHHRYRQAECKHIKAALAVYDAKWQQAGRRAGEVYCRAKSQDDIKKLLGELWKHLFSQKQLTKRKDNE